MTDLDAAADPTQPHNGLPVLCKTGPYVNGVFSMTDGTQYNLTSEYVQVNPAHLEELVHHTEQAIEAASVFLVADDTPFTHDSAACAVCPEG